MEWKRNEKIKYSHKKKKKTVRSRVDLWSLRQVKFEFCGLSIRKRNLGLDKVGAPFSIFQKELFITEKVKTGLLRTQNA